MPHPHRLPMSPFKAAQREPPTVVASTTCRRSAGTTCGRSAGVTSLRSSCTGQVAQHAPQLRQGWLTDHGPATSTPLRPHVTVAGAGDDGPGRLHAPLLHRAIDLLADDAHPEHAIVLGPAHRWRKRRSVKRRPRGQRTPSRDRTQVTMAWCDGALATALCSPRSCARRWEELERAVETVEQLTARVAIALRGRMSERPELA